MRILLIYSTITILVISRGTAESYIQLHSDWLQVQRYICTVWYLIRTYVFIGPELCVHC